jgi:hypothetical protein
MAEPATVIQTLHVKKWTGPKRAGPTLVKRLELKSVCGNGS